jgi:hypothetical protein
LYRAAACLVTPRCAIWLPRGRPDGRTARGRQARESRPGRPYLGDLIGTASVDNVDVGGADEAEDDLEVGAFEIVGLHRRARGVFAAAGDDNGELLSCGKTLETLRAKAESLVETDDVLDPGLQDRGDVEVVHRGGDNDFVGGHQLGDELIGDIESGFVLGRVGVGSAQGPGDPRQIGIR